jgi:hypothetical protein
VGSTPSVGTILKIKGQANHAGFASPAKALVTLAKFSAGREWPMNILFIFH